MSGRGYIIRLSELKHVPTSGNPEQFFCLPPTRRDEDSFQQRLLRKQRAHFVHTHIAWHKLMVLTRLFTLEHVQNENFIQFYRREF